MSTDPRIEAAAKAYRDEGPPYSHENGIAAALAAADAVMFSEEAIERATEVLLEGYQGWCHCRRSPFDKHDVNPPCATRVDATARVRAVVAALRGGAE